MEVKYLIGYDDDNHDIMFWFDRECIGDDVFDVAVTMFDLGNGQDDYVKLQRIYMSWDIFADAELTEDEMDILHNYLCFRKIIDEDIWKALTEEDYKAAVKIIQERN